MPEPHISAPDEVTVTSTSTLPVAGPDPAETVDACQRALADLERRFGRPSDEALRQVYADFYPGVTYHSVA